MTKTTNSTVKTSRPSRAQKLAIRRDAGLPALADRVVSPALAAALRALADQSPAYQAAREAHNEAEEAYQRVHADPAATDAEKLVTVRREQRLERAYHGALTQRRDRLGGAILKAPAATIGDVLVKLDAYARACECSDITRLDFDENSAFALEAVVRDLRRLLPPESDRKAWERARAAYEAAWTVERAAAEATDKADAAVDIDAPLPAALLDVEDALYLSRARTLEKLSTHPDAADLAPIYTNWHDRMTEAKALHRCSELNAAWEAADDTLWAAFEALMATRAPTLADLAFKWEVFEKFHDRVNLPGERKGFTDLAGVALMLDISMADSGGLLEMYRDVLHMVGRGDDPAATVSFKPDRWINLYEANGGLVTVPEFRGLYLHYPPHDRTANADLERELAQEPWKQRAVFLAACRRAEHGGDRLVDSYGYYRLPMNGRPMPTPEPKIITRHELTAAGDQGAEDVDSVLAAQKLEAQA